MHEQPHRRLYFASYDFSNSGYALTFQSFLFPLLLSSLHGGSQLRFSSDVLWSALVMTSSALAIVAAPFVGRLGDRVGKGRIFANLVFLVGGIATAALLAWPADLRALAISFIVFNTLFELSQSLYDSFLLDYEPSSTGVTTLSTLAWGFGYVGGAVFAVVYFAFDRLGLSPPVSLSLFSLLFLVLSLPAVQQFWHAHASKSQGNGGGLRDLLRVSSPVPWSQLLIYWIIGDCVSAIMYFAPLYMKQELGFGTRTLGALFLGAQLLAFPLTVAVGRVANRFGVMRTVRASLAVWFVSVLGLYLARSVGHVVLVMIGLAFVFGSTQALLRAHFANRVQSDRSGEGLGFYAIAQKSSSVAAPAVVGIAAATTGSLRPAFLALGALLLIAFLLSTRMQEAQRR